MEKTVYLFPKKNLVVTKGNIHKHPGEHVVLDNSPINELTIISIGGKRIKVSYKVNGKVVTVYTRTNINDFISECVIDDKISKEALRNYCAWFCCVEIKFKMIIIHV